MDSTDIAMRAVLRYINNFQISHDMEAWVVRSRLKSEKFSTLFSPRRLLVGFLFRQKSSANSCS